MDYSKYEDRHLSIEVEGKVALATLNRPETLNAIGDGLHEAMEDFLTEVGVSEEINAVVLTGAGRGFSSGGDVKSIANFAEGTTPEPRSPMDLLRSPKHLIQKFLNCEVPIIAAVNGVAAGLGATLALMSDVIFASDRARIGDTHVRAGLVAGDGGAVIWPYLIGPHRAKELLMSGRLLNADEASKIGLVNRVVPADQLLHEAMEFAHELATGPTLAIRLPKMTINRHLWPSLNTSLEFGLLAEQITFGSQDSKEAASAFMEKRAPKFTGR